MSIGEYVKKAKDEKTSLEEVMEKRKSAKLQELEEVQIEAQIAEYKKKMEVSGGTLPPGQSSNMLAMLLQGRKPEEIKQIVDSLDEASLDKLAYLAAAMNGQQLGMFTQTLRRPETNVKDTIDLINTIVKMNQKPPEQQGITLQGIAALMKEVREAQTPQAPQQSTIETLKTYHEMFLKPVLDQLQTKDRENVELRMREIESRIVNPGDYIKNIKEVAKDLGLSSGGRSEIDLKLAEMAQNERLEYKKLDWEMMKHQEDKEGEKQLYGLIGEVVKGPVADLTKNIGGAAARRIDRGSTSNPSTPQIIDIPCPQCKKPFSILAGSPLVLCPNCKTVLGPQQTPQVQQDQPPPQTEPPAQASEVPQPEQQPTQQ